MFTIVRTEHPECSTCKAMAEFAIGMARVTGSSRSSYGDGTGHRATVVRNDLGD